MLTIGLRALLVLIVTLWFAFGSGADAQKSSRPTFRIMLVADGESQLFVERQRLLKTEILELMKEDASVVFVEPKTTTDWTLERAEAALKEGLADRSVHMIIVSGTMTGVAVGRLPKLNKPVLIPYAAPDLQGLPQDGNRSGRRNLAYIVSRSPNALVVARSNVAGGDLNMVGQIATCRDPSRIQVAEVPAGGSSVLLAFVSCFLARSVQVIDTDKFQGITILTNISGAFEFVIDAPRLLMYTADFSTSVLRVADLRPLVACLEGGADGPEECSPQLLGLVGLPQPVSELPR